MNLTTTTADRIIKKFLTDANSSKPTPHLGLDDSDARDKLGAFIKDALADLYANLGGAFVIGGTYTGGRVPAGFAGGGVVPGRAPTQKRKDNMLAMSTRGNPLLVRSGEWIINERASEDNHRLLAAINSGAKFRTAEVVTSSPQTTVNHETHVTNTNVFNGPESFSEGRREGDWWAKYGTRYGSATEPAAL